MSRLLDTKLIRSIETDALAATAPGTLMTRAASALAEVCARRLQTLPAQTPVLALVGPGNNGGDALLACLLLARRGWRVEAVALTADPPRAEDARRARAQWQASGRSLLRPEAIADWLDGAPAPPLVIDGLFGIGLQRALDGAARDMAHVIQARGLLTMAGDVPSGIDADTGAIVGDAQALAVRAHITLSFIADKPGLHTGAGRTHAGEVLVADLGLQDQVQQVFDTALATGDPGAGERLQSHWVQSVLPTRALDSHKGRHGDVLVLRGESGMAGASILALLGAQAVGAGRLTLGIDPSAPAGGAASEPMRWLPPELMTRVTPIGEPHGPERDSGWRDSQVQAALQSLGAAHAVVAGCGMGQQEWSQRALLRVLAHPGALVLDADALNGAARSPQGIRLLATRAHSNQATVLTPHPLEAARLLGTDTATIQRDRIGAARQLADLSRSVVVLKGAGTVIAWPRGSALAAEGPSHSGGAMSPGWAISTRGGPLLSVAGTGDVLAGVIGGLLAQGLSARDAACAGVWLHGAAADHLTQDPDWAGGIGLPASALPSAVRVVINRLAAGHFAG